MNYAKPEIVLDGSALTSIESLLCKPFGDKFDAPFYLCIGTMNAYEADE